MPPGLVEQPGTGRDPAQQDRQHRPEERERHAADDPHHRPVEHAHQVRLAVGQVPDPVVGEAGGAGALHLLEHLGRCEEQDPERADHAEQGVEHQRAADHRGPDDDRAGAPAEQQPHPQQRRDRVGAEDVPVEQQRRVQEPQQQHRPVASAHHQPHHARLHPAVHARTVKLHHAVAEQEREQRHRPMVHRDRHHELHRGVQRPQRRHMRGHAHAALMAPQEPGHVRDRDQREHQTARDVRGQGAGRCSVARGRGRGGGGAVRGGQGGRAVHGGPFAEAARSRGARRCDRPLERSHRGLRAHATNVGALSWMPCAPVMHAPPRGQGRLPRRGGHCHRAVGLPDARRAPPDA